MISFRRPIVKNGEVLDQGAMTVFINGVLVQDNTPIEGGGGYKARSKPRPFPEAGPLQLQDHGNPVRYRNIWYRNLRKRAVDGGTDGQLSPEATTAKRAEIAAGIRGKAASASGREQVLLLMESLCYQPDAAVNTKVAADGAKWLEEMKATPTGQLASRKNEVLQVHTAVEYLVKHKCMAPGTPLQNELTAFVNANGWNEEK